MVHRNCPSVYLSVGPSAHTKLGAEGEKGIQFVQLL